MGTKTKELVAAHNGRYDAFQAELLANPETVHVTISGKSVPFLLGVDGFERAAAAGHDPMPAIGRLVAALFDGDMEVDKLAEAVNTATLGKVLTTSLLSDLVPLLYAGVVSFDRGLSYDVFKARVTLPTVFSVVTNALPQMVALVTGVEGETETDPPADGDEGN